MRTLVSPALKNPAELAARLDLAGKRSLLFVDVPEELRDLVSAARNSRAEEPRVVEGRAIRSVKESFEGILLWREERVGSQAILEGLARKLEPDGTIWIVTAMRKVSGPRTPAVHRLDRQDLEKILGEKGLVAKGELRVSAWHVAYGYAKK
jgi:hypothetical protein